MKQTSLVLIQSRNNASNSDAGEEPITMQLSRINNELQVLSTSMIMWYMVSLSENYHSGFTMITLLDLAQRSTLVQFSLLLVDFDASVNGDTNPMGCQVSAFKRF